MVVLEGSGNICSWPRIYIPEPCRGVEVVIGIDEAGRGPVLGSLLYCAAFWPATEHEAICKLGFDDSKQLKEGERDRFFDRIRNHGSIGWVIAELSAERISQEMLRRSPMSLNALSYDAVVWMLEAIRDFKLGEPPVVTNIFIDTVGDPDYYKSWLVRHMGEEFATYIIEKKADATYKVVSAASIIAKVTRDTSIKEWAWAEACLRPRLAPAAEQHAQVQAQVPSQASTGSTDSTTTITTTTTTSTSNQSRTNPSPSPCPGLDLNFGSGYPGDENCVKWLSSAQHHVFGFPNLVRFSWSTSR